MLEKKLIINKTAAEIRIALVENGRLAEIFIERNWEKSLVGNIYKGTVGRVLPGMNCAFIDIGLDKSAFLFGGDTYSGEPSEIPREFDQESEDDSEVSRVPPPDISKILEDGEEIVVQVVKEAIGTKGPRVTMHPTLAGRYLVLMPYTPYVAMSRRIKNDGEKSRLSAITEKLKEESKLGIIVRTSAQGISREPIHRDFYQLKKAWDSLSLKIEDSKARGLIHSDLDLIKKTVRDLFDTDITSIVVDDYNTYQSLKSFFSENIPEAYKFLKFHTEKLPVFDLYGIEIDIARALHRRVDLPSGGYLIIDQSEALTAFDVNTGRYVGKLNARETILKTNLEATLKVVEQIRLRNIGGIIVVDFIDMELPEDQEKLYQTFLEALKTDRALTNVLPVNELGLLQLTRKRTRESLGRKLLDHCPVCYSHGSIMSVQTEALELLREIIRQSIQSNSKKIRANVRPEVHEWVVNHEKKSLKKICDDLGIEIEFITSKVSFDHLREFSFEVSC